MHHQDGIIVSERAPEPVGPYPHGRRVGNLIFVSGIGPRRRGEKAIPGVRLNSEGEWPAMSSRCSAGAPWTTSG